MASAESPISRDEKVKVLVISLDNMGDTVISLSILKALKKFRPRWSISYWAKAYAKDIFLFAPETDECFFSDPFWDVSPAAGKGSLFGFLKTLSEVKKHSFDIALVLHSNWKKNLLCRLAGIREIWSFKRSFSHFSVPGPCRDEHILDAYSRLLSSLLNENVENLDYEMNVPVFPGKASVNLIVFHPFSGNSSRNIPLKEWIRLILHFSGKGFKTAIIGSMKDGLAAEKHLRELLDGTDVIFSWNTLPEIKEIVRLISSARLFVGHDSGPLHIASALGVKSIGIISQEKKKRISPRGKSVPELICFRAFPSEIDSERIISKMEELL